MMLSKRSRQLFLLLLLSLAVYALFNENQSPALQHPADQSDFERPTAFIGQSHISAYNSEGLPYLTITSRETLQYDTQDKVTIFSPVVNYLTNDENTYTVNAEKGFYYQDKSVIDLEGNVLLSQQSILLNDKQDQTQNLSTLSLSSEKLSLDLGKRFISTDRAVKIIRGPHTLSALGMQIMLDQKILSLHKKVRGRYVID